MDKRTAQKLAQNGNARNSDMEMPKMSALPAPRNGGFCGALQRAPPSLPTSLARRLANKENYGVGKVKVILRVTDTDNSNDEGQPHFMSIDKKKRQVTLMDPSAINAIAASTSQDRGPMVAAPKMFAFDSLFTAEDQELDVCGSALSEIIPAVLEGSDGCLLTIGYPNTGQSKTMLGNLNQPEELGAIPCAISWLYKGINERKHRSGARFSVRVSALGVSATKPDLLSKDLLAAHATGCTNDSPGVYLRDNFLGGPTELRAPTAERAALFLDAAIAGRPKIGLEPAMLFTLHVYQYCLSRKGGVAGGRSRLHLIDLGGCANRSGGLPLSSIGNILLAILSRQRHPPNKEHPLTSLLKDCLAPLSCHVAIVAHVSHSQSHTDALTMIQLASRIHRMRRRKHRFPMPTDKTAAILGLSSNMKGGPQMTTGSPAGSSADPSSSEMSADTVIYIGRSDDATDGEHPPLYFPVLNNVDNRGVISKPVKGCGLEKQLVTAPQLSGITNKTNIQKAQQTVTTTSRTGAKHGHSSSPSTQQHQLSLTAEQHISQHHCSPIHSTKILPKSDSSSKIVAGSLRYVPMSTVLCSKGSNVPSPKGSPLRKSGIGEHIDCHSSPLRKISEEQWIDGPRVSRAKVAEARHLLREVNHVKQCETWIDGPKSQSSRSLTVGNLPAAPSQVQGYGFMDSHKKTMIRLWVENQTSQVFQAASAASSPTHSHPEQQAKYLRNSTHQISHTNQKLLTLIEDINPTTAQQQQKSFTRNSLSTKQLESTHPNEDGLVTVTNFSNSSIIADSNGPTIQNSQHSWDLALHLTNQSQQQFQNLIRTKDETELNSLHSHQSNGGCGIVQDNDEDQDSGPSEIPPALPLIKPLGSHEISHENLHNILSCHASRESLYHQQQHLHSLSRQSLPQFPEHSTSDCGLQVTEEEIACTMGSSNPLAALSENISIVSSFSMVGEAYSDCAIGERVRNQFDQLARLREIFTSQLDMAEVTPVFRSACDMGSVCSEPAYCFNTAPESVCSEPSNRQASPRQPSHASSKESEPSFNETTQAGGMDQFTSVIPRDGESVQNLLKIEQEDRKEADEKVSLLATSKRQPLQRDRDTYTTTHLTTTIPVTLQTHLPLLPLNISSEAYDSGHDSSTPRASKHSSISRRAESGYHSVATARDSDESSFTSVISKETHNRITVRKKRHEKGLCSWLINPFNCKYPQTEGEVSDF